MNEAVVDGGANAPADAVVIDQTQVNSGEPLPPQAEARQKEQVEIAPEKITSREAVKIAQDKIKQRNEERAAKEVEQPKDAKPDLKAEKQPKQEVEQKEVKAERERAPDGKFASKEPKEQPKPDQRGQDNDYRNPPSRFDDAAKTRWADVPDEVKANIHRSHRELENGIQKYKESSQKYESVRYFDEWAAQSGTSLKDALTSYTNMEQLLRNPQTRAQGLMELARNMGTDPMTLAQELAQASSGNYSQNYQQQQAQIDPRKLAYEIEQNITHRMEQRDTVNQIEQFKRDNPRFDELSGDIAMFLESGKIPEHLPRLQRLQEAYDLAERLSPAFDSETLTPSRDTRQVLAQTQDEDDRPIRPAGKSISGAPSAGSNPDTPRQASSNRDAVRLARKRLGG